MGNKKLVVFNSIGGNDYKLYATVNANTEDLVIAELTGAAISDANLFCDSENATDSDSVTGTIRRMLEPLGFEFFDSEPFPTVDWDNHKQSESLLSIRILHAGYTSETDADGFINIRTDKGMFRVNSMIATSGTDEVYWAYSSSNDPSINDPSGYSFQKLIALLDAQHTQSSLTN